MATVTSTEQSTKVIVHPRWCVPERCGHLVPPLMPQMARRHRSAVQRIGHIAAGGFVAMYLIGPGVQAPVVALHVVSRSHGRGWAELSLLDVAQLVHRLNRLLNQAGFPMEGGNGDHD